ncbi:13252_t:CDS:2, partial [Racocetra persica]
VPFYLLVEEFDTAMKHLNFSMAIDFEKQRELDHDELIISLIEIKEILKISGLNSEVISEVNIMKSQDTSVFKPVQIDAKDLTPCSMRPNERASYLFK